MTYAVSSALQAAVFQALSADPTVSGLVGNAIYDALPSGTVPPLYVSIGPESVRDRSDKSGRGALHLFSVSVVADDTGFQSAKTVAAAVCDALVDADLALARGHLVALGFDRATAKREGVGQARRIDLRFRARVEDN